jgi:hypothetical protein
MKRSSQDNTLDEIIYPREDKPYGITWEDWTVRWWQWLLSIQKENNPGLDPTGAKFDPNQRDPNVIFLAGTFEGHAERKYVIPAGKSILFPIVNFTTSYTEEPQLKTESELISCAKEDIDSIVKKEVIIDGLKLCDIEKYRVQSPVFDLVYPEDNVFGFVHGPTKAISDGYWIFLKSLTPGIHEIYACGSCYSGRTTESITWNLEVRGNEK